MRKKIAAVILAGVLAGAFGMTAYAGQWKSNDQGWWFQNDDGTYLTNGWYWIDGNGDGSAEKYYFYPDGYMAHNNKIGALQVNQTGQWESHGVVQTKIVAPGTVEFIRN